jgi:hypothetical protein
MAAGRLLSPTDGSVAVPMQVSHLNIPHEHIKLMTDDVQQELLSFIVFGPLYAAHADQLPCNLSCSL